MTITTPSTEHQSFEERHPAPPTATSSPNPPWTSQRIIMWGLSIGFIAASLWGLRRVELSLVGIIDGWPETQNLLERMWPPVISADDRQVIIEAILDTFFMIFAVGNNYQHTVLLLHIVVVAAC